MRNRYYDLLRCLAIVRVVVYHVTGWAFLTLAFPAMSVMFALGGALMASSLDRFGPAAVGRRLRRLLPSLWLVALVFVPAMLLTGLAPSWRLVFWVLPLADPPANTWGALVLSVVWYLRDYLWFVLVSPAARWLFRRWPVPTLLAPYLLLGVVEFGFPDAPGVLRDFGLYYGAWLLGFAQHDGLLRRLSRRLLFGIAVPVGIAGLGWILGHPGPRGYDLNDVPLGNALWSVAFVLLVFGLAPPAAAGVDRAGGDRVVGWVDRVVAGVDRRVRLGRAVTVLNSRALTVYLWHMPFVIAVNELLSGLGLAHSSALGLAARLAAVAVLVGVAVAVFGWVEDLAARRPPRLLPAAPERTPALPVRAPAGAGELPAPAGQPAGFSWTGR
ncbi:acyltransferase [Micromonospora sp. WMMD1102]|uniref:acyltransferase family protein n=1 Tax=Micromonospora sp. WMMD1102 TaxID=3016105 RepID=UPI002414DE3E|nr:acyltransferase [Micromonospora sp. WMMD1102]MDG4789242.1 acyltransferase [Micromonospora sp. WMMD1102]